MGMLKPDIHDNLINVRTAGLFDDFYSYTDTQLWTKGATGGSASVAANATGVCGLLTLTTGGTQNQEAWVRTTNKPFIFQAASPLIFQCEINYTDADTNNAGIFVGFASSFAAGFLTDTTGVPSTNFSGAGIYKLPGESVWRAITSVGTSQAASQSVNSCTQPAINQRLIVQAMVVQSNIEVTYYAGTPGTPGNAGSVGATTGGINLAGMQPLLLNFNSSGIAQRAIPIKHTVAFAGAAAMQAGVFVKNPASASSQVVSLDYIGTEFLGRGW